MSKVIKLTKGLDLPLEGRAAEEIKSVSRPEVFSIVLTTTPESSPNWL